MFAHSFAELFAPTIKIGENKIKDLTIFKS
jgi:hypothetical protein